MSRVTRVTSSIAKSNGITANATVLAPNLTFRSSSINVLARGIEKVERPLLFLLTDTIRSTRVTQ